MRVIINDGVFFWDTEEAVEQVLADERVASCKVVSYTNENNILYINLD